MTRERSRSLFAFGLAAIAACAPSRTPDAPKPEALPPIALAPCAIPHLSKRALCGKARVYEDRAANSGRTIDLDVLVVKAWAEPRRDDPIVPVLGGPGMAATFGVDDEMLGGLPAALAQRDWVFVDQRGTGKDSPLRCGLRDAIALPVDALRTCARTIDARPELYGTAEAADDVDEVLGRLGYGAVNLYGLSYGTVVTQQLLRAHPARVRSAAMDGVAPIGVHRTVAFATSAQRALDELLDECTHDDVCRAAFPTLPAERDRAVARLRAMPEVAMFVRDLLYSPMQRGLVPLFAHAAAIGDEATLDRARRAHHEDPLSAGLYLSVTCSEDVAGLTPAEADRIDGATFLGTARVGPILRACEVWPRRAIAPAFHEPVASDAPVLLLSGTIDPATPATWAETLRPRMPRTQSVLVPGGGHGAGIAPCPTEIWARFLDRPTAAIDASCVKPVKTKFATDPRALDASK